MKRYKWLLTGSAVFCLAIVLLAGCGVPQADYDALQADYNALNADNDALQADYNALNADNDALQADYDALYTNYVAVEAELADIQQVYPPRDFESRQELVDWRNGAGIFDTINPTDDCRSLQQVALRDGYIVSVSTGLELDSPVGCRAIAGDSFYQLLPWELGVFWIGYAY